jgi:hypothetical protein
MMLMQITIEEPLPMPLAVMMLAQCWMMADPATREMAVLGTKEALRASAHGYKHACSLDELDVWAAVSDNHT